MTQPLHSDDIDAIGADGVRGTDPRVHAARLVDAVDAARLADAEDTGYALSVAASLTEKAGDLVGAEALSARAVAAAGERGLDRDWLRALNAEHLVKLGREEEGMGVLESLRPLLTRDPAAAFHIVGALEEVDRQEVAEQWLGAALTTTLERAERAADRGDQHARDLAMEIASPLAQQRHRVRRDLDLPHDEHDDLADELSAEKDDELGEDDVMVELFWPQQAFDELTRAAPHIAEVYGETWDAHRTAIEAALQDEVAVGAPWPALIRVSMPDLTDRAARTGLTLDDAELYELYAEEPDERTVVLPWPPGRNDACWCGSGTKYKKCCLPRPRA